MDELTRELRRSIIRRHARLLPSGKPLFCQPSVMELAGYIPRKQGRGTDGKPIYDSREIAEDAAREMEAIGAPPQRAYRCNRSRAGHFHLTTDRVRARQLGTPATREDTNP